MGVRSRHVEKYYQDLLSAENNSGNNTEQNSTRLDNNSEGLTTDSVCVPEKWKGQIEKVFTSHGHSTLASNSFICGANCICI